jgi:hypothetical protein
MNSMVKSMSEKQTAGATGPAHGETTDLGVGDLF